MSARPVRDDETPPVERVESPGKRLRIARQAQGLTQDKVASQLHLSVPMIQALEDDNYDGLPGPVFVRGYLRNYARLLNMDEAQLLHSYRTARPSETEAPPAVRPGPRVRQEIRGGHATMKIASWAVVLGLAAVLVIWWQGRYELDVDLPDLSADAPPFALPAEGQTPPPPAPAAEADAPEDAPAAPEPAPALPASAPGVPAGPPPAPTVVAQDAAPASGTPQTTPTPADARAVPVAEPTEAASQPAEAGPAVVFEFVGSCWVDVRDASRKYKLFGEMRKGDRRTLEGTAPWSVILGNSPMVRISIDGKPFDIEAHARGSVARFTLDPNQPE